MGRFPPWMCCRHEEEQIKLSEVPASTVSYVGTGHNILPDSFSQLVDIETLNLGGVSPAWSSAEVDALLIDAANAVIADAGHFTKSAITLAIGSGNGAPGGTFRAPSGDGGVPVSGFEAIWVLVHNTGHVWTISFTGGLALGQVLGPTEDITAAAYTTSYIYATPYVVPFASVLSRYVVYASAAVTVYIGVYSDVAGVPTNLLSSVGPSVLAAGANVIPLSSPLIMAAGTYWVAWQVNTNTRLQYCSCAGYPYVYKAKSWGAFNATFPSGYTVAANIKSAIKGYGVLGQ